MDSFGSFLENKWSVHQLSQNYSLETLSQGKSLGNMQSLESHENLKRETEEEACQSLGNWLNVESNENLMFPTLVAARRRWILAEEENLSGSDVQCNTGPVYNPWCVKPGIVFIGCLFSESVILFDFEVAFIVFFCKTSSTKHSAFVKRDYFSQLLCIQVLSDWYETMHDPLGCYNSRKKSKETW